MKIRVTSLLDHLRDVTLQVKTDASGSLANGGAARFMRKPTADRWNAAECLEHLNRYGDFYLPLLEEATAADHQTGGLESYRTGLLGGPFAKSMKLNEQGTVGRTMRSPKGWNPQGEPVRDNVLLEFLDQQERYLGVIEAAREVDIRTQRVPLSVFKSIKISVGDMLQVLVYHNQRHMAQAMRASKGQ